MHIRRGKPLDSGRLKRDLNKSASITNAAAFSRGIAPGPMQELCNACDGAAAGDLAGVYGFQWRECAQCGSAFVANPPSQADIEAAYRSDYYTAANKVLLANDNVIDYRLDAVARPKVAFVAEHLTTAAKTWLDIGCGVGEILAAAKERGFRTLGLETNAMEAEYGRSRFGIDVRNEYVNETTIESYRNQRGVVSLFSVLEHVVHPRATIKAVAAIQSPGDNLVIETPHFPSLSAYSQMCFPEHINRMMHPPLHLFLFSTKALESMLSANGYEMRAIWYFGQDFYELLSTLGVLHNGINGSRLHEAASRLTNAFQQAIDDHGLSDEMLIVAEKVAPSADRHA